MTEHMAEYLLPGIFGCFGFAPPLSPDESTAASHMALKLAAPLVYQNLGLSSLLRASEGSRG